jgi:DNA-binding response OmpR family regulator
MSPSKRVLILGRESARLFALSGYLTQRGFQVDRAEVVDDARALIAGLQYRALVASIDDETPAERVGRLIRDLKQDRQIHTVALLEARSSVAVADLPGVDDVYSAGYSIGQLARSLCSTIGH